MRAPGVGRANLTAAERGVLHVNVPALELINNIYDGITIATRRAYSLVDAGEMVALVKVVPFGVPAARVVDVERIAEAGAAVLQVRPLQANAGGADRLRHGVDARAPAEELSRTGAAADRRLGQPTARADLYRPRCRVAAAIARRRGARSTATRRLDSGGEHIGDHRPRGCRALGAAAGRRQHHAARRAGRSGHAADDGLPGR